MEYLEALIAVRILSIRGWAAVPVSTAHLGRKPQQSEEKTIASNTG